MSLTYLSGPDDNYLGLSEVGTPRRRRSTSGGRDRSLARQEAYKARMERRRAELMMRRARRAAESAADKIQKANASTTEARALSMDEIGRRKSGGGGGGGSNKQARQEARQARQTAKKERIQAKQAIKKAKVEAKQARQAAVRAKRATAKAQKVAAKTQRVQARTTARAARKKAVPAPIVRRRLTAAPAPMVEDVEAEFIEDEEPEAIEEETTEEPEEESEEEEGESIEGYLGLDEIGARKGKIKRQAKRAARKEKRTVKKTTRKTKRTTKKDKRGGSVAKKIALAPVRLALFAMMKVNALKIRTKLRQAWKKDKNAVNTKLVKKFGFKLDNFLRELNRKENERLSGAEFGSIEAAIATATPALIAVAALLKQLGINPENLAKVKGQPGEEIENIPGQDEGTPGSNFKISTPMIIGAAAIAAFFILKKK